MGGGRGGAKSWPVNGIVVKKVLIFGSELLISLNESWSVGLEDYGILKIMAFQVVIRIPQGCQLALN